MPAAGEGLATTRVIPTLGYTTPIGASLSIRTRL